MRAWELPKIMAVEKGADLDELFGFLSDTGSGGDEGPGGGGVGKDELDFVDSINQDLDTMIGSEVSGGSAPPQKEAAGGVQSKKTTGKKAGPSAKVQPKADKTKAKSKFKWKK